MWMCVKKAFCHIILTSTIVYVYLFFDRKWGIKRDFSFLISDEDLSCKVCGGVFGTRSSVSRHWKYVCGKNVSHLLSCEKCGRKYKHPQSLLRHRNLECGMEAQFPCPVKSCNYKSRQQGNVKRHCARIHSMNVTI